MRHTLVMRRKCASSEWEIMTLSSLRAAPSLRLHLEDHARTYESYEQWAISEFAEALLTIPKTLAQNAALDGIDLLASLRVRHNSSQTSTDDKKKDYRWYGL